MKVMWTSTDVVCIGIMGVSFTPVVLWICIMPNTLSGHDSVVVASKCQELLGNYHITDIKVEICELVITCSASSPLFTPVQPPLLVMFIRKGSKKE